ncbi:MAG TPA: CAP domain-containing protein [Chloroflexota bacterium]
MKRPLPLLASALATVSIAALAMPASTMAALPATSDSEFLSLLNSDRASAGLPPLAVDSTLSGIAQQRAQEQLASGTLSHYDSSGSLAFQSLLSSSGVQYTSAGENLAENSYPSSQTVTQANAQLMASAPHAANILNPAYNAVGVAVVGPDANGNYFYTEIFGALPGGASGGPAPSTTATASTGSNNSTPTISTGTTTQPAASQQATTQDLDDQAHKDADAADDLQERAKKLHDKADRESDDRAEHLRQRAIRLEDEAKRLEARAQRLLQEAGQPQSSQSSTTPGGNTATSSGSGTAEGGPRGCAFGNGQAEGQTASAPGCAIARAHRQAVSTPGSQPPQQPQQSAPKLTLPNTLLTTGLGQAHVKQMAGGQEHGANGRGHKDR